MVHHDRTNKLPPMKTDQPTATAAFAASIDSTIDTTAAADKQPLVSASSTPCSTGMNIKSEASGISSSSELNSNPLIEEQLGQHESDELHPKKQDQQDIGMLCDDATNDEHFNVIINSSELLGIDHPSGAAATAETRCKSTDRCNNQTANDVSEDEDEDDSKGGNQIVASNEAIATTIADDVSNLGNDLIKDCHILEPQVQAQAASSTEHQTFDAATGFDGVHKEDKNIATNKTTTLIITTTEDRSNNKGGGAATAITTTANATGLGNSKNPQQQSSCPPGHIYALRDIILEEPTLEHDNEQQQSNAPPQDRGSSTSSSSPQDCLITKDSIKEEQEEQEKQRVESCPPRPSAVAVFEESTTTNEKGGQQQLPPPRIVTSHVVRTSESVYQQLETMSAGTVLCPTSCLAVTMLETMGLPEETKEVDDFENTSTTNEYDTNEWLQFRASLVVGTSSKKSTTSPVSSSECLERKTHMQDREYYDEEESSASSSLLIAAVSTSAIKKKMESKFVDVSIKYPFSCNVGGGEGCDTANEEEEDGQISPSGAHRSRGASKKKKKKLRRFFHSMNCLGNRRKNLDRDGAASEVSVGAVVSRKGLDGVTQNNIHEGTNPSASNSRPKMIITNGVIDWENSNLDGNCCHILSHNCSFVAYSACNAESLMATGADGGNSDVRGEGEGGGNKDNKATMMTRNTVTTTPYLHTSSLGATIFGDAAVIHNTIRPINEIVYVDESLGIYISESGLSSSDCQNIINTSEFCASNRGGWSSYTYAKQTLGCRENDQLAFVCARPVMTACATIRKHLMAAMPSNDGDNEASNSTKCNGSYEKDTSCELNRPIRMQELVLDVREPHVVKYDTSRVERQKLDMHTDKSEWTFLIALSEGRGQDYKGGGTYFQALSSTVHLQRGQMVIFRGKLRHSGVQIFHGCRYLLVGFLVPATKIAAASK